MARVGTLEWAGKTGGQLTTLRDRLALLLSQGIPTKIEELVARLPIFLGGAKGADLASRQALDDIAEIRIPTSPISRAAEELCERVSQPWLQAHCYRTYAIGTLMGRGLSFDP